MTLSVVLVVIMLRVNMRNVVMLSVITLSVVVPLYTLPLSGQLYPDGTVVELSTHYPEMEGSNPTPGTGREEIDIKVVWIDRSIHIRIHFNYRKCN
jgi:hypothetical protein